MTKDGLDLEVNGDYLSAKGTSLGGDDGIAVAYALAVLDSNDIAHPPIEAVLQLMKKLVFRCRLHWYIRFKRQRVNQSWFWGRRNFTISCAGGATVECLLPYNTEPINAKIIELRLSDLPVVIPVWKLLNGELMQTVFRSYL